MAPSALNLAAGPTPFHRRFKYRHLRGCARQIALRVVQIPRVLEVHPKLGGGFQELRQGFKNSSSSTSPGWVGGRWVGIIQLSSEETNIFRDRATTHLIDFQDDDERTAEQQIRRLMNLDGLRKHRDFSLGIKPLLASVELCPSIDSSPVRLRQLQRAWCRFARTLLPDASAVNPAAVGAAREWASGRSPVCRMLPGAHWCLWRIVPARRRCDLGGSKEPR